MIEGVSPAPPTVPDLGNGMETAGLARRGFPAAGPAGPQMYSPVCPPQFVYAASACLGGLCAPPPFTPTVCVRCRHLPRPVVCVAISVVCGPHQGMYTIASLMYFSARHLAGETLSDLNRRRLPSVHTLRSSAHNRNRASAAVHTTGIGRRRRCTQPEESDDGRHTTEKSREGGAHKAENSTPPHPLHPRYANLWSDCAGRLRVLSAFLRGGGTSGITESDLTEPSREGGKNI